MGATLPPVDRQNPARRIHRSCGFRPDCARLVGYPGSINAPHDEPGDPSWTRAAGCKATGGGWIPSNNGAKKATFGFVWQTTSDPDKYLAQGSWADGSVKFKLKDGLFIQFSDSCGFGMGGYISQNRNNPGSGDLLMTVCDYGEPGPTNGDTICVDPVTGPYAWYDNAGELRGGNLQVKSTSMQ